jgi:hypothetical protein
MLYILHSVVKSAQQSVSNDPNPSTQRKAMKSEALFITSTSNS